METLPQRKSGTYPIIGLIVFIACILLFSLDKDMHSASDFLKAGNLIALGIYFLPAFLLSLLFFKLFRKKHDRTQSLTAGLLLGIITGFTLVICTFLILKRLYPDA